MSGLISDARKVKRSQKPASVMVWAGITPTDKTPLYFVDPGVKINKKVYQLEILEGILLPWSKQHFGDQHWIFQQDSAPSHKAKTTQTWCTENFPSFISSAEWPPYSPDLNPLDCSLWSILESNVSATEYKNLESLKHVLEVAWAKIDEEILRRIVQKFPERLRAVVKAKGGYIEG